MKKFYIQVEETNEPVNLNYEPSQEFRDDLVELYHVDANMLQQAIQRYAGHQRKIRVVRSV